ncbi:MAG: hypothetical protein EHJ95_04745, partial [Methanobacteriota archaeon]
MNKLAYVMGMLCIVSIVHVAGAKYGGGSGTTIDPFQIWTAEQLVEMSLHSEDWDRCFVLRTDVDVSVYMFEGAVIAPCMDPNEWCADKAFRGTFDGNGHTIRNLTVFGTSGTGLFGTLAEGGLVKGLGVVDAVVICEGGDVGIIVGDNGGSVADCYSTGTVSGDTSVGGLVGVNKGSISRSHSTARVSGGSFVGGVTGWNLDSVSTSHSTGAVSGDSDVGGLVGWNAGR